jgi:hypothetical protein
LPSSPSLPSSTSLPSGKFVGLLSWSNQPPQKGFPDSRYQPPWKRYSTVPVLVDGEAGGSLGQPVEAWKELQRSTGTGMLDQK